MIDERFRYERRTISPRTMIDERFGHERRSILRTTNHSATNANDSAANDERSTNDEPFRRDANDSARTTNHSAANANDSARTTLDSARRRGGSSDPPGSTRPPGPQLRTIDTRAAQVRIRDLAGVADVV